MSLPHSRNRTYANHEPVSSADLVDMQEQYVAIWKGRRKLTSVGINGLGFQGTQWTISSPYRQASSGGANDHGRVALRLGDRIRSVRFSYRKATATNMTGLLMASIGGVESTIATLTLDGASVTWLTKINAGLSYRLASPDAIVYARINSGAAGDQHSGLEILFDHPRSDAGAF